MEVLGARPLKLLRPQIKEPYMIEYTQKSHKIPHKSPMFLPKSTKYPVQTSATQASGLFVFMSCVCFNIRKRALFSCKTSLFFGKRALYIPRELALRDVLDLRDYVVEFSVHKRALYFCKRALTTVNPNLIRDPGKVNKTNNQFRPKEFFFDNSGVK